MAEIILRGGHIIKPDTVYPDFRFIVEMHIDRDYIQYLSELYGTMPGTQLLKTNCGASACFTLGVVTTEDYAKETLEGQLAKYKAEKKYGRNALDYFSHIALTFNVKGKFELTMIDFKLKYFKIDEIAHNFNKMIEAIKKTLRDDTGTLFQYGAFKEDGITSAGAHIVSIVKTNGKLILYDYQQQYCVEEAYILQTIISQSLPGIFNIQSSTGFSSIAYEGYSYITKLSEAHERLYVTMFTPLSGVPMYDGPGLRSLGIMNRMRLYRDIKTFDIREIIFDTYKQKGIDLKRLTEASRESLVMLSVSELEERAEYVMESYGTLTIEPWFLPTNLIEERLLRELAEHRLRYWPNTTAEESRVREAEIQTSIEKDKRTSSIVFANGIDLRIMRDDIVTKLQEFIVKVLRTPVTQIRKVKGVLPMNTA